MTNPAAARAISARWRPIRYHGLDEEVRLGDWVELRVFFRKRTGRVVYVPGISKPHREMAYGGLEDVGIRLQEGTFIATVVIPPSFRLKKGIRFLRHDPLGVAEVDPGERLFEDSENEDDSCSQ